MPKWHFGLSESRLYSRATSFSTPSKFLRSKTSSAMPEPSPELPVYLRKFSKEMERGKSDRTLQLGTPRASKNLCKFCHGHRMVRGIKMGGKGSGRFGHKGQLILQLTCPVCAKT